MDIKQQNSDFENEKRQIMEQYSDKIAAITKKHLKDMQENTQRLQLEFDEKILKANNQAQQEIENIKLELSQKNWELEDKNLALLKKSNNLEEVIGQVSPCLPLHFSPISPPALHSQPSSLRLQICSRQSTCLPSRQVQGFLRQGHLE